VPTSALSDMAGISLIDTTELVSVRLELLDFRNHGVLIPRLDPNGPAARAGMRPGDVLTHINGREVGQSDQVRSLITSMLPEQRVTLRVWRFDPERDAGTAIEFAVTLAQLEPPRLVGRLPDVQIRDSIPELGIARMSTATRDSVERLGVPYHPGVLLEEFVPGSDLERNIPPGSIIVMAMDQPVTNVDQLVDLLRRVNLLRGAPVVMVDPEGNRVTEVLRMR
jgi:serine protease Do